MEELVRKHFPFFEAGLRKAISESGVLREFSADEELIREEQYIRSFPIVLSGIIRVCRSEEAGREILLYYLRPGEVCTITLTCCMDRTLSKVKAVCDENTSAILIPVERLDKWMSEYQTWKEYVMRSMQFRFNELLQTIDSIAFYQMDERLEKFFLKRFRSTGSMIFQGSHQDIANALNSTREVISRLLKQMEKAGMLQLSRGKIDYSPICDKKY
ncbi:MAG: Crp/Fnr family transcriptional regulator [Bacteroidetes bacterium]|nr:MAG: Crp/Fnr family transcriptional regulator [Bacteroidota bacterium]